MLTPDAVAVYYNGIGYSYQILASQVVRLAKSLERDGVSKGMLIGHDFADSYENLIFHLAVEATGAVPFYTSSLKTLTSDLIAHLDAIYINEVVACTARIFPARAWMVESLTMAIVKEDYQLLARCAASGDPVYFGSTSATTGLPKYFFETKDVACFGMAHMLLHYFPEGVNDFICVYGLRIYAAYAGCMCALNKGGTIHFIPLHGIAKQLQFHQGLHLALILRDAKVLLDSMSAISKASSNLHSLRILGDFLPANIRHGLEAKLCKRVINTYSSNEAGQIAEVFADGSAEIFDQVSVQILNMDLQAVAPLVQGRIAVKSPMVVSFYLWNESLNAAHFRDGWFISNDLGYLTVDHKLHCLGRLDDMLIIGGIKIPPYPIEMQLKNIAGINDAALVADTLKLGADKVLVCIEYTQPMEIISINTAVIACLAQQFLDPVLYYLVSFPRTETGKVRRTSLIEKYLQHKGNGTAMK